MKILSAKHWQVLGKISLAYSITPLLFWLLNVFGSEQALSFFAIAVSASFFTLLATQTTGKDPK